VRDLRSTFELPTFDKTHPTELGGKPVRSRWSCLVYVGFGSLADTAARLHYVCSTLKSRLARRDFIKSFCAWSRVMRFVPKADIAVYLMNHHERQEQEPLND